MGYYDDPIGELPLRVKVVGLTVVLALIAAVGYGVVVAPQPGG